MACVNAAWYLVAYCHRRREVRLFVPDRIREIEESGLRRADPRGQSPCAASRAASAAQAGLDSVARWVMSFGGECEVLAPEALGRKVVEGLKAGLRRNRGRKGSPRE